MKRVGDADATAPQRALEEGARQWHPLASTLADPAQHQLITSISGWSRVAGDTVTRLGEEDHQARLIALEGIGAQPVFAVLGRSLTADRFGVRTAFGADMARWRSLARLC